MGIFNATYAHRRTAALVLAIYFSIICPRLHGQIITTVAGNGIAGFSGDGAPAIAAELNYPIGIAADAEGNFYIADSLNERIREVSLGTISTIAGNGTPGYTGDGGNVLQAEFHYPQGIAFDTDGNLYVADAFNSVVREISTSGIVTTIAGGRFSGFSGDGGQATDAQLSSPTGVSVDASGNIYIADLANNRIRKVSAAGIITTVAGNGTFGYSGDGGPATDAELRRPGGVLADGAGNIFIADTQNYCIRKVSAGGTITTIAGNGTPGFSGDGGPALAAQLNAPYSIALDGSGNVLFADNLNNRIREVGTDGTITTIVGNGVGGYSGDGGSAVDAEIYLPSGVFVRGGAIYISDTGNQRIRLVTINEIFSNGFD